MLAAITIINKLSYQSCDWKICSFFILQFDNVQIKDKFNKHKMEMDVAARKLFPVLQFAVFSPFASHKIFDDIV